MNKEESLKSLLLRRSILEDMKTELGKDEKLYIDKFCKYKLGDKLPEPFSNEILDITIDDYGMFEYTIYRDLYVDDFVEEWELNTLFKYGDGFVDHLGTELFITNLRYDYDKKEIIYELCEDIEISENLLKENFKQVKRNE